MFYMLFKTFVNLVALMHSKIKAYPCLPAHVHAIASAFMIYVNVCVLFFFFNIMYIIFTELVL